MNVLHIDAGITPNSVSRQISAAVVAALKAGGSPVNLTYRDLAADPIPHLDGQGLAGLGQDEALAEFFAAEVIVIGAPMYNFGVASQLKAWIDRILVAGKTFRYTPEGPQGLAGSRRIIVASSRGGAYAGDMAASFDFQERYLSAVFGFMGVKDIRFVRAEGVQLSPERREEALADALRRAPEVAAGIAAGFAPALAA
ncbi:MAG: FMN-dependent NADH-azoreductase [Caulobacteraceae bacterium]